MLGKTIPDHAHEHRAVFTCVHLDHITDDHSVLHLQTGRAGGGSVSTTDKLTALRGYEDTGLGRKGG